ncbi:MAG: hypothetical protein ACRDJC_26820 [Thermomicrobiales bacterium]
MDGLGLVILGVPLVALTMGGVQGLKELGLPSRFAGLGAVAVASLLVALNDIRGGEGISWEQGADWLLIGIVYGLAAAGSYSQVKEWYEQRALARVSPGHRNGPKALEGELGE